MFKTSDDEIDGIENEGEGGNKKEDKPIDKSIIISTGNSEIDDKMGGGVPLTSLSLIEGDNDTGKSVLTQQMLWGGLNQGYKMTMYTTENTMKSMIKQMGSLSLHIDEYFLFGHVKIFPIELDKIESSSGKVNMLDFILNNMAHEKADVVVIDSLTVLITQSDQKEIYGFFSGCKRLCDEGKTILITAHRYAFDEETLVRIRSICDGHIELRINEMGERIMRTMRVAKMRGAQRSTGNIVNFDIEPEFGLRIVPMSSVSA